jgi:hypothetical protein
MSIIRKVRVFNKVNNERGKEIKVISGKKNNKSCYRTLPLQVSSLNDVMAISAGY